MTTLSSAITEYFEAKNAQRLSVHTLSDYGNTFRKFSAYVGDHCQIESIDPATIARFLASTSELSRKTTLNYHTALSSLWTYLVRVDRAKENIVRRVTPPRPDKKQVAPFSRDEIVALLNVDKRRPPVSTRNRAIILLLLDTGLRASELCSLKVMDINLAARKLRTKGKGGKERYIPFHASTREAIDMYFKSRSVTSSRATGKSPAFATLSEHPVEIERRTLLKIVERIGLRANIPNCHPHRFRHTFAIQFLRNGGNIYTLQALLGHTSLDMVKRYLAISQIDMDKDHEKASPVKGWNL
ncbi:MAG: tyrosine-type recombinase/integrase [Chloroflexi bacterium]|nr:tyrosine-type recombinase/integrase [Chloroflexota bacterium]MBI3340828.1 tyrosine-type recombinase/integrase [Chloroflexota bacterium]